MATGFKPMLSFGAITTAMDDQYKLAEERRKKEMENQVVDTAISEQAARESQAVAEQSFQSAEVTRKQQLEILGGIDGELKKANRAIELGSSENPLDRLTLYALQQADPSYTRDGNIRRIEYYQKAADAVGGIEAIKQTAFQDQLKQVENNKQFAQMQNDSDLAMLQLMELQGKERIDAVTNYTAQLSGQLTQQNNIQDQALANVPDESVDAAIVEAQKAPDKKANVGGVPISLAKLQDRKLAITERQFLQTNRNNELATRALDMMPPEEVEKATEQAAANGGLYTTESGVQIPFHRLRERRAANLNMDFTEQSQAEVIRGYDESNRRRLDEKLLATYSTGELTSMLAGDGTDPKTKTRFDKDQIKQALTTSQEAEQKKFQLDFMVESGQLTALPAKENIDYIDSLNVVPGSQLATALANQRKINLTAAGVLGRDDADPANKMDMLAVTSGSRETIDAAIRQQATINAGPGADKDLIALNEAVIRRQPLPPEIAEAIINEKSVDPKKTLAGILNQDMNGVFVRAFSDKLDQLNNPANTMATMGMSTADKRKEAAAYAMTALTAAASGGLTERMMGAQATIPGNPLRTNGISGATFLTLSKKADEAGIKQYLEQGRTPEGVDKNKVTPEMLRASPPADLLVLQQAHMLIELEKLKPGLAKQYTDWWASPDSEKFTAGFTQAESMQKNTVSDMMTWSLVAPTVPSQMTTYSQIVLAGRESMVADVIAKEHADYINFGGSPEAKQAYLIDATPELNDQEKKVGLTLIQPILQKAKEQGMNTAQTAAFVEGQLAVMQAPAGTPATVLKKMQNGRGAALQTIERFNKANGNTRSQGAFWMPRELINTLTGTQFPVDAAAAQFEWMK